MILQRITSWMQRWYWLLIAGIVLTGTGMAMYIWPTAAIAVMMILISFSVIAFGLVALLQVLKNKDRRQNWILKSVSALLMIITGTVLLERPAAAALYINAVIALLLISRGAQLLVRYFTRSQHRAADPVHGWLYSIILVLAAIFIWNRPQFTGLFLVSLSGLPFLILGFVSIVFAVLLYNGNKRIQIMKSRVEDQTKDAEYEIIN